MQNGLTKLVDDVHSTLYADESRFRPGVVQSTPRTLATSIGATSISIAGACEPSAQSFGDREEAPAAPKRTKEQDMTKAELDA